MANPFGEIIDDDKLDQMPKYVEKKKTREDRAREAMSLVKKSQGMAQKYVDSLKQLFSQGVSTLCLMYNATGETLYYVSDHDWCGFIGRTPYPVEIGNGQWAAFQHLHKMDEDNGGSEGALVLRGKNKDGDCRDFMVAWSTPYETLTFNKAYCDVGALGSFDGQSCWKDIYETMTKDGGKKYSTNKEGVIIEVETSTGKAPVFHATIKIPID